MGCGHHVVVRPSCAPGEHNISLAGWCTRCNKTFHEPWGFPASSKVVSLRGGIMRILIKVHGNNCYYCYNEFTRDNLPTKDHVIPRSKGGSGRLCNLVPACKPCNQRKGDNMGILGGAYAANSSITDISQYRRNS